MGEGVAKRLRPAGRDFAKVGIALLNPALLAYLQLVLAIDQKIDWHADGEIGPERRIEGDEQQLRGSAHAHVGISDTIEDRLAVFVFADLEVGGILSRLDEVSLLIDLEKTRALADDLPAQDEGGAEEARVVFDDLLLVAPELPDSLADEARRLEHRSARTERMMLGAEIHLLVQKTDDRLGEGQ